MVKNSKLIGIALVMMMLALSGCTDVKETGTGIEGTYVPANHNVNSYLTLNPDGTFFVSQDDSRGGSFVGAWKLENNTLLLIKRNGNVIRGAVVNGTLIDPDGDVWLKR